MDEQQHQMMAAVQDRHWWYRGRRTLVSQLLETYVRAPRGTARILEIGAGTGSNISVLRTFGSVTAVEPAAFAAAHISATYPDVTCVSLEWPHAGDALGQFDAILLLDVLEHLDDDLGALRAVRRHLAPEGIVLITVPAYQSMWSAHDELLWHKRRYSRSELESRIREAGFTAVQTSGFNWVLFPVAWLARRLGPATGDRLPPVALNAMLSMVLRCEVSAMSRGIRPRFGLSIVTVLRGTES